MIKDIINIIKDNINNKKNIDNTYVTQNVAIDDFKNNKHDSQINLENDFKWLDKILYCSLEQEINLAINKDMIGTMEYSYILKSYKITGVSNSITLELERKGDAYRISFNDIYNIKSAGPKIWIYQKDLTWRIYHYVDEIKFSSLEENFISKNLELQEDIQNSWIDSDTKVYFSFGTNETTNLDKTYAMYQFFYDQFIDRGASCYINVVQDGNHNEASWEKENPIYLDYLWK